MSVFLDLFIGYDGSLILLGELHKIQGLVPHYTSDLTKNRTPVRFLYFVSSTVPVIVGVVSLNLGYIGGKRKRKVVYGKTRKEVADKLLALQQQHQSGVNFAADKQTVAAYLLQWLETVVKETNHVNTYAMYEQMCRIHSIPAIGHIQLDKLAPDHVQQMITALRKKAISDRTVQYAYRILSVAIGWAVKFGYLSRNVITLVDAPKIKKHIVEPLTVEQTQRLLALVAPPIPIP